jgi:molecular chaperone GrpE
VGERFDPHKHEAVEVIEDEKAQEDVVVDELQPGYTLGGRIIRPARVKVHKCKKEINKEKTEEGKKEQIEEKKENKEKME